MWLTPHYRTKYPRILRGEANCEDSTPPKKKERKKI